MRVAVLGTGIMGAPIARNIAAAGHEVSAWNRSREKAEPLAEHGVTVAGSVAEEGKLVVLAEGLGVDPRTFLATIDGAPVGAPYAQLKGPMMIDGEFPPAFPLDLAAKDAGLALEAAEAAGLRLEALAAVAEQMRRASEAGHGDEDMAATIHASRPA